MNTPEPVLEVTLVQHCLEVIRQQILTGELLPGETLRQANLAERLGASRVPVREALSSLLAEGVVTYVPRVGYTVARFDSQELTEIYTMRELLERELLLNIDLATVDVDYLKRLNDSLEQLDELDMLWEHKRLNREFHFSLFRIAQLPTIVGEVERLWNVSEFYRSLYAYEPDSQRRIVAEHRRIIDAVRACDGERLIIEVNSHRSIALDVMKRRLGPGRSHSPARRRPE